MKIINKIFLRSFLLQALWNFENMQGTGFMYSMMPKLKELYSGEKLKDAVMRYLGYFNTHPYMVPFVLGSCSRIEEDDITTREKRNRIRNFKLRMGGPLAALGDKMFWSTFRPLIGLLAVVASIIVMRHVDNHRYYLIIPAAFILVYNIPILLFKYRSLVFSYTGRVSVVSSLEKISRSRLFNIMPMLGMVSIFMCLAAAFAMWGFQEGLLLLLFTVAIVFVRSLFKLSVTTLVYAVAALAIGYSMLF